MIADQVRQPTRRQLLATGASFALAPSVAAAATSTPGADMVARANALLLGLSADQRDRAGFTFDDATRARWNFMGTRPKPGLQLADMTPAQKVQAMDLLAAGLNADGVAKAERVMVLQDVLRERGSGSSSRSRERFSFAVFGTPSATAPWGWRIEGHHLSLSWTLVGGEVVAVTPSSFSSNPNVVRGGSHDGLVALVDEERLARRLYGDLSAANRRAALIREDAFGNIQATAGRENRFSGEREGVPLADLHPAQADLLARLAEVYAVEHLPAPLAERQRERLRAGDTGAWHFAWAGSDVPGDMMYYRIATDAFLIEFASLRNQPLHLHTICHDLERNLGAHAIG